MVRASYVLIALHLLLGTACLASAGRHPKIDEDIDVKSSCEAAATCYFSTACRDSDSEKEHKDDRGTPFRNCFFECLEDRVDDGDDGDDFVEYVEEVYEWWEDEKRNRDAPEGKLLKCTLKKIKKDVCDDYFPSDWKPYYD